MHAIQIPQADPLDYWKGTTEVPCPCGGTIHWAEAGFVPGCRACNKCNVLFMVRGHGADRRLVPQTLDKQYHISDAPSGTPVEELYKVSENYFHPNR